MRYKKKNTTQSNRIWPFSCDLFRNRSLPHSFMNCHLPASLSKTSLRLGCSFVAWTFEMKLALLSFQLGICSYLKRAVKETSEAPGGLVGHWTVQKIGGVFYFFLLSQDVRGFFCLVCFACLAVKVRYTGEIKLFAIGSFKVPVPHPNNVWWEIFN